MATTADAEVILKLYDIRREAVTRKARAFAAFEFAPETTEELLAVQRGEGTEENALWRHVLGYWEMAASLVVRGAVDADLFFDSNGEGIYIYVRFHELYKTATGAEFMPQTAAMIRQFPRAQELYDRIRAGMSKAAADPVVKADQSFHKG